MIMDDYMKKKKKKKKKNAAPYLTVTSLLKRLSDLISLEQ